MGGGGCSPGKGGGASWLSEREYEHSGRYQPGRVGVSFPTRGGLEVPGASPAMGGLLCPGDVGDYEPQLAGATSRERRLLGPEGGEYQPGGAGLDDPRKW